MKLIEMKLPAHWVCALFYGSYIGCDGAKVNGVSEPSRIQLLTDGLYCIDASEEAEFTWGSNDCPGEPAGDYRTYIFQVLD